MAVGALLGAAGLAVLIGFLVHRWWFFIAVVVLGALGILIDVSTRDLTGAGHDDRGLVAIVEAILLSVLATALAVGIAIGKRRSDHARRPSKDGAPST